VAYIICGCGGMKMKKTEASVFVIEDTEDEGGSDATKSNPRPAEDDTRCTMDEERRPCPCCRVLRVGCAVM
jgi:hypothetical protein